MKYSVRLPEFTFCALVAMVSTYYLVKLFQRATYERLKRNLDGFGEGTSGTNASSAATHSKNISITIKTCRVCLKEEGTKPIFGDDSTSDMSVAIRVFGDIEVKEEDDYPKYLCDACHTLLEAAILFRKTAKQSHQVLRKRHIKQEHHPDTQDWDYPQDTKEHKPKQNHSTILENFFSTVDIPEDSKESQKRKKIKVQCRICYKIITKAYYKEHFALHDATIVKYMCDVCGKSFRQRCAYRNHYFTHSSEFPYKCSMCPYRGRNSGLLNTHMRTHTGDYRYMCTECPARFLTKSNLNKHTFRHKEPMFKCDTCNRAFHSKLILERHFEAEHLGIKNHVCNLCGKAFGYRKAMMRHQLDVHKREKKVNGRTPSYLEAEFKKQQELM